MLLHLAWETPLLQPRMPPPRSPGVRVALQISVWACAGAARASSAVAARRARQARGPGPCVRFPASQRRRAPGRAPAPAAMPSGSEAQSISVFPLSDVPACSGTGPHDSGRRGHRNPPRDLPGFHHRSAHKLPLQLYTILCYYLVLSLVVERIVREYNSNYRSRTGSHRSGCSSAPNHQPAVVGRKEENG